MPPEISRSIKCTTFLIGAFFYFPARMVARSRVPPQRGDRGYPRSYACGDINSRTRRGRGTKPPERREAAREPPPGEGAAHQPAGSTSCAAGGPRRSDPRTRRERDQRRGRPQEARDGESATRGDRGAAKPAANRRGAEGEHSRARRRGKAGGCRACAAHGRARPRTATREGGNARPRGSRPQSRKRGGR